jgi:DNA-binding CsgD family transcriptional regulator
MRQPVPSEEFTPRQKEILEYLCAVPPMTQQEIARALNIDYRTVRGHVYDMLSKSGLPDARALAVVELHRRMARQDVTEMSRAGRRLAVVTVRPIVPTHVDEAIIMLEIAGKTVHVLSVDVAAVLAGLEAGA